MEKFNNGLTDSELERLAILAEECAEVQQICMKIIRHGYGSHNPLDERQTPNRELLNKELGDLDCIITMMSECGDINRFAVKLFRVKKQESLQQYLHHNTIKQINWDQTP